MGAVAAVVAVVVVATRWIRVEWFERLHRATNRARTTSLGAASCIPPPRLQARRNTTLGFKSFLCPGPWIRSEKVCQTGVEDTSVADSHKQSWTRSPTFSPTCAATSTPTSSPANVPRLPSTPTTRRADDARRKEAAARAAQGPRAGRRQLGSHLHPQCTTAAECSPKEFVLTRLGHAHTEPLCSRGKCPCDVAGSPALHRQCFAPRALDAPGVGRPGVWATRSRGAESTPSLPAPSNPFCST